MIVVLVLVSAIYPHKLATGIHMFTPSRKMVLMSLSVNLQGSNEDADILVDTAGVGGERGGGMN